jgi:hypothetical protein
LTEQWQEDFFFLCKVQTDNRIQSVQDASETDGKFIIKLSSTVKFVRQRFTFVSKTHYLVVVSFHCVCCVRVSHQACNLWIHNNGFNLGVRNQSIKDEHPTSLNGDF